ncbi:Glutathione S-transferase D4-like Protein [Tribolium castaneum]|uniref:Glutathione S-transferase D4-like Protein n=1 Tax=Tribolium castaneum TaxID=7070 RepID=D6WCV4_TRICA|nr:PREDICTED: glutathione S-transferase 1 [Tribolium castaneum]EEZ99066.1 Glutathione S-transferase D4-like Protein [Tribolium castaneum]|eukprot:XP_966966.2 PREDICTED: glutathione S-transferase 1 [Tribolium castaneum]
MAPTLHMLYASPPARAVMMTAKAIGLELNLKEVDFMNEEHLKPEYVKMNPQHTIPTLVDDDGFIIWDSHAIMIYLVSKYAKDDALYPKDIKKRAVIDQRLHFESGVVFALLRRIARPIVIGGQDFIEEKNQKGVIESYAFLDQFLDGRKWVAGDFKSIADYSLLSSISTLNKVIPVDPEKYPRVIAWLKKCEELPEYEANRKGVQEMADMINSKLAKK